MDYCTLQNKCKNGTPLNDDDIWWMKDLHIAYMLGMTIHNKQNKIRVARMVAAAVTTTTTATSNNANNSISSSGTLADLSTSTLINANEITASKSIFYYFTALLQ